MENAVTPEGYPENAETARDGRELLRRSDADGDRTWAALLQLQRDIMPRPDEAPEGPSKPTAEHSNK